MPSYTLLVSDVQSLLNKVDELECVVNNNKVDFVCITETWLSDEIPDSAPRGDGQFYFVPK